jgi:hypothetical protein
MQIWKLHEDKSCGESPCTRLQVFSTAVGLTWYLCTTGQAHVCPVHTVHCTALGQEKYRPDLRHPCEHCPILGQGMGEITHTASPTSREKM